VEASPSIDELIRIAITQQRQIRFWYGGKERIAEPHDYGIQKGKERLLAYQVGGRSTSGSLPAWRLVDVSGMTQLEILEKTFPGNRPAPSGRRHTWDRLFIRVGEAPEPPSESDAEQSGRKLTTEGTEEHKED
jgi:hypothetical protein